MKFFQLSKVIWIIKNQIGKFLDSEDFISVFIKKIKWLSRSKKLTNIYLILK